MTSYQTLLRVAVEHSYHLDGVCASLSFRPTEKTRALFSNTGLIFKKTTDGIRIVYDRSCLEALKLYAQDKEEPLSFDFKVYSEDPDFKSYTKPDIVGANTILYFDNRKAAKSARQNLQVSKYVSDKDIRPTDAAELVDILGSRDRLLPPECVVRLFANDDKGDFLKQWLEPDPTIYSIRFDSRRRYWKYYLLGKLVSESEAGHVYSVVDPDKQVEFEATGQEVLSGQKVAYTFRSKQKIPFNDYCPLRFQLKQKIPGDEIVVINRLPVARINQIGIDRVAGQATVVAEIYINS